MRFALHRVWAASCVWLADSTFMHELVESHISRTPLPAFSTRTSFLHSLAQRTGSASCIGDKYSARDASMLVERWPSLRESAGWKSLQDPKGKVVACGALYIGTRTFSKVLFTAPLRSSNGPLTWTPTRNQINATPRISKQGRIPSAWRDPPLDSNWTRGRLDTRYLFWITKIIPVYTKEMQA